MDKTVTATLCPTCGHSMPMIDAVADLMKRLSSHPNADVYFCKGGGYAISYGEGKVMQETIIEAERLGLIRKRWPEKPELQCWVLA